MNLDKVERVLKNKRVTIGKKKTDFTELPPLIEIQNKSFEWFIQRERLREGGELQNQGLHQLFQNFPHH